MLRPRFQHSILGLLALVTLVAIVVASIMTYRRSFKASLRWIDPRSVEAVQLFPKPAVSQNPAGKYEFEYYAQHRDIQRLLAATKSSSFSVSEEAVKVTADSKADADTALAALTVTDVLPPGNLVIRGRILDQHGKPLSGAIIDLLGSFVFINCFQTRRDGTFTLALSDEAPNVPTVGVYQLRVRAFDESHRWESLSFELNATTPEKVVEIVVHE